MKQAYGQNKVRTTENFRSFLLFFIDRNRQHRAGDLVQWTHLCGFPLGFQYRVFKRAHEIADTTVTGFQQGFEFRIRH